MEAEHGAELHVEIDVLVVLLLPVARRSGQRRLDEAAPVVDVSAHRHAQDAFRRALRLHRSLVAARQAERREARGRHLARLVDVDRPLHGGVRRLDDHVLEARSRRLVDERECCLAGLTRDLRPSRKQIVDLGLGEVRLDRKPAVAAGGWYAAGELDGHRPGQEATEIEAELGARRFVERRLHADISIGVARLAVVERGGDAVELDVTTDPMALVVGAHLQQVCLDLLAHEHVLSREVGDIHVDGVGRGSGREVLLQRQAECHLRGDRPAAGRGIERRARIVAKPLHAEQLGDRGHRPIEAETRLGRRRLREGVGHLEHTVGDRELAAGRDVNVAAPEIDRCGAARDAHVHVGIADRRQPFDRSDLGAVPDDVD